MKKDAEKATAVCKTLFPRTEYGWGWDASDDLQSALVESLPGLTIDYSGLVRSALVVPPQVVEPGLEDLVGCW